MPTPKGHVLFVAYDYPPSKQAGAKRAEGFHRFLPEWGYRSTLITVQPPTGDDAKEQGVVRVRPTGYRQGLARISTRAPSPPVQFLTRLYKEMVDIPDGYRSFFAPACAAGRSIAAEDRVCAVVATSSPYTSLRIGSALGRELKVPWLADLRDLWTHNHYGYRHGRLRFLIDSWLEKRWLNTASRVVTATKGFSAQLAKNGIQSTTIYNGFLDLMDYEPAPQGSFRISFLGTLYEGVGHSPQPFFEALARLRAQALGAFARVRVDFFGAVNQEFWELRERLSLADAVQYRGLVSGSEASVEARRSDLLLVLLADRPDQAVQVPTKLFDYGATGRPVLFVGPEGEGAELVRKTQLGGTFRATQVSDMADWIEGLVRAKEEGRAQAWGESKLVSRFHYRERARELAQELDAMIEEWRAPTSPQTP